MSEPKPKYKFRYVLKVRTVGEREAMDISIEWAEAADLRGVEETMKSGVDRIISHFLGVEADKKKERPRLTTEAEADSK